MKAMKTVRPIPEIRAIIIENKINISVIKGSLDAISTDLVEIKSLLRRTAPYERKQQ